MALPHYLLPQINFTTRAQSAEMCSIIIPSTSLAYRNTCMWFWPGILLILRPRIILSPCQIPNSSQSQLICWSCNIPSLRLHNIVTIHHWLALACISRLSYVILLGEHIALVLKCRMYHHDSGTIVFSIQNAIQGVFRRWNFFKFCTFLH